MWFTTKKIAVSSRSRVKMVTRVEELVQTENDCQVQIFGRGKIYEKDVHFLHGCTPINLSIDKFTDPNVGAPVYVTKHLGAYAIGQTSIISSDGYLSKDSILNNRFFNEKILKRSSSSEFLVDFKFDEEKFSKINFPVFALTSSGLQQAYTHWFTETLTKLAAYQVVQNHLSTRLKLLLDSNVAEYQLEMLSLLGFEKEDFIFQSKNKCLELSEVYLPSPVGLYKFHEKSLDIYNKMLEKFDISKVNPLYLQAGNKIFLRRKKLALRRSLINIDELASVAEEFGFESIAPEDMNIHDKMFVFSNATHLVGEAGGGMTNVFFSNGNKVLILASDAFSSPIFTNISALRNVGVSYLFGCSIQGVSKKHDNNSNFVIACQSFEKSISKFLGR